MSPTLSPNHHVSGERDLVLVIRRTLGGSVYSDLRRGDVVTLTKPHDPSGESVKRVVGLPGDTVLRDLRRVGKQEQEDGKFTKELGMKVLPPVIRVAQGSAWVEGDAWRMSRDSNDFGSVSQSLINGRVWGVVWPLSRFGTLPRSDPISKAPQMARSLAPKGKRVKGPDSGTVVIEGVSEAIVPLL